MNVCVVHLALASPFLPASFLEDKQSIGFQKQFDAVEFDTGKATIRKESYPRLDRVVEYMTHKKQSRILITGHTDNVGKKASNKALSENRAQACRKYLVDKGIDGSRVQAKGFGDERPIAPNDTPDGRQKNRRIEAEEI